MQRSRVTDVPPSDEASNATRLRPSLIGAAGQGWVRALVLLACVGLSLLIAGALWQVATLLAPVLVLFFAGWLLNLTPGPDVLYIVSHSLRAGVRAGLVAGLGITAGCFVHVFAAALGVSERSTCEPSWRGRWLDCIHRRSETFPRLPPTVSR